MPGAEALVALGLASNVVQFIDFGSKLCSRINEYASSAIGAPKKITALAARLDLVLKTLNALNDNGRSTVDHEANTIRSCISEAQDFNALLDKFKLKTRVALDGEDSPCWVDKKLTSAEKIWKAFRSLRGEDKVREFQESLDRLLSLVNLQLQSRTASTSTRLEDKTGVIMKKSEQTLDILNDMQMRMKEIRLDREVLPVNCQPIILVPYSRNQQFVSRGNVFEELDKKIFRNPNQHHAALHGLGGVGKSQIALEYAYRVKQLSPEFSIFWVCASNAARFEEAYKRISDECNIPGRENPKDDLMQLVRNWLETKIEMPWLMIVDNVDDAKEFFQETNTGKSLCDYIPKSSNGHILYTTRSRDIGWDLTGDSISVLPMTHEEAGTLLDTKTGQNNTEEEKTELLNELDYLPLAITQAAAFMAKRRKTVSQYLSLYRHSDSAKVRLLSHDFADHGTETRRLESVATTWIISFEYIKNENQRASEILSLMSFLDRQGIPESLIYIEGEDPVTFADAVGLLEAFSLVVVNKEGDSYNMHRLVQAATRAWLNKYDSGGETIWASRALSLLSKRFPNSCYTIQKLCTAYLPHAEAILGYVFKDIARNDLLNRAYLLSFTARYFETTAIYDIARERAQESLQIFDRLLGPEDPKTLTSMSLLAVVLISQGDYLAAEKLQRRVLETIEHAEGHEHPRTLRSMSRLALTLICQCKYEGAEEMYRQVLEWMDQVLGPEHPDTLAAASNLALVLGNQGKYEEAEEMNRRALEGLEKVLGPWHPLTLRSVSHLGLILGYQCKYELAKEMNRRALEGFERVLGPEHPDTLAATSSLGLVLYMQGKHEGAEEMERRALEGLEKVLGPEHPKTLTSVYNLAYLLHSQKRYDDASAHYLRACTGYQKMLGSNHIYTLKCSKNYNFMLEHMEKANRDSVGWLAAEELIHLNRPSTDVRGNASVKQEIGVLTTEDLDSVLPSLVFIGD